MPAPRLLPSDRDLQRWVDQGLTHAEIAEKVYEQTGHKVARSTVSAALSRAGLTVREGVRYKEEIPWRVHTKHITEYPARMLRLLGRRNARLPMSETDDQRLDAWLANLRKQNLVVAYCPDTTPGFLYVLADEVADGKGGIPIRRRTISLDEIDN